ncbi:MAG: guanylate kinase [Gammaproteobacteria bacterium]|nr:guanylate kinase [Gammaproteobacteria bacterium]
MSEKGKLFVVSAPSGAGKTSLVKAMLETEPGLKVAISHTTRPKRSSEVDGINYYFIDDVTFRQLIEEEAFIEHAKVFDNYYGTSKSEVNKLLGAGNDLILEIDWQGARQIRARLTDCISIFILPPSLTTLKERLQGRGMDDAASIDKRTREAISEISHYGEFDFLVVNDDFDKALTQLLAIVREQPENLKRDYQSSQMEKLIAELLPENPAEA